MKKWIEKLKKAFTMTPKELKYAEIELRYLFGLEKKEVIPEFKGLIP